jgi:hypothetical protein
MVIVERLRPKWINSVHYLSVLRSLYLSALGFVNVIETMFPSFDECDFEFAKQMIGWALRTTSLFIRVNKALRLCPIRIIKNYVDEFHDFLSYVYLLQFAIEKLCSEWIDTVSVFRGFPEGGQVLAAQYGELVGELIVWSGFSMASVEIGKVVQNFVRGNDGILFEIVLTPGTIAVTLGFDDTEESDVLIAAGSIFKVESVSTFVDDEHGWEIPIVKLTWNSSWSDDGIENVSS